MISKPLNLAIKPVIPYGSKAKAILSLLKEHPEGLTIAQVAKLLKEKNESVGKCIYGQLKSGTIQRDDLSRYSLAPQSCLIPGLTDNHHEIPNTVTETVTEIPGKARRQKKIIGGFTFELYEFVKNNEGLTAAAISQHFGKKNDIIRPYLHRLKDYGYLINDNGYWKKARETVIESSINIYPSGQSFGFSAPLSKATV